VTLRSTSGYRIDAEPTIAIVAERARDRGLARRLLVADSDSILRHGRLEPGMGLTERVNGGKIRPPGRTPSSDFMAVSGDAGPAK